MIVDFSQPQHQSKVGIVVMFFHTLQQYLRGLWPVVLIFFLKMDKMSGLWIVYGILILVTLIILIGVVAYLKFINFTFYLDNENAEFVISEGVFNKSKTTIQLDKIQQVNINQNFIQRIIGVYALDVDTAGSTKKEGNIKAISHPLAIALKARLLDNEKKTVTIDEVDRVQNPVYEERPFIKISFLSLLKVGITSNYVRTIGLMLATLITLYENVKNVAGFSDVGQDKLNSYFDRSLAMRSLLIVLAFVILAVLIVNVVRVIFKYYDFKITKQSGSLLLSFGLVNTKSTIIKPEKVQIISVSRNYFQKKMDILELKIKQATSGEKEERKSAIEIPGCNEHERDAIMRLLFKAVPEKGVMLQPNFRKLVFSVFLAIVVPLCVFFYFAYAVESGAREFVYLVPVYVIFIGLVLYFGFQNYRLFVNDRFIIKQSGAWDVENQIIEPQKIQAITTSQLFWHKGINIGSLTLHTAGGNVSFQLGDFDKIKGYVNLWLYEMERSDSNWM